MSWSLSIDQSWKFSGMAQFFAAASPDFADRFLQDRLNHRVWGRYNAASRERLVPRIDPALLDSGQALSMNCIHAIH
jgi:hypothetical protein